MAYTFTPPLVKTVPPFGPDSTQAQVDLWRHYENRYRGVNVWILSDNTVVQSDATTENSNTDLSNVLPGDSLLGKDPYVTSIFIDPAANPQVPTIHTTSHNPYVVAKFYGGRTYTITAAQATLLTNYTAHGAGYADCITGP